MPSREGEFRAARARSLRLPLSYHHRRCSCCIHVRAALKIISAVWAELVLNREGGLYSASIEEKSWAACIGKRGHR